MSSTTAGIEPNQPVSRRVLASDAIGFGLAFAMLLTITQRGVGFIRNLVFCRLMTESELGQWSLCWSYLMLLAPVAALGLPGCFCRFVEHYRGSSQLTAFLKRTSLVTGIGTVMMAVGMLAFARSFSIFLFGDEQSVWTVRVLAAVLIPVALFNHASSLVESLCQVRLVTIMRFLLGIVFAFTAIPLLAITSAGRADLAAMAYGVSCLVALVPAIWFFRKANLLSGQHCHLPAWQMWKRVVPFAGWLWLVNIVSNLFEVTDRWMLVQFSNLDVSAAQGLVGQYHSARVIPLVLIGIAAVVDGLLMPFLTAAWERDDKTSGRRLLNDAVRWMAIGFTLAASMLLVMSPWVFENFLAGRYQQGLSILGPSLALAVWFSLFTMAQGWLWVAEKGKWVFAITVGGLVANLALNLCWIPVMGLPGAVMATTTATMASLTATMLANRWAGCLMDLRTWIAALLPAALLLSARDQWGVALLLLITVFHTEWLVTASQRNEMKDVLIRSWTRLRG